MHKRRFWFFALYLIMGKSQNWPDPRSPKSKFRDIHFVGIDTLMLSQKFHIDPSKTIVPTRPQTFLEVRSLDLTWWPDLRWPWAQIFRKVAERVGDEWCKKRRRAALPFFGPLENRRGVFKHPPAGGGLKGHFHLQKVVSIVIVELLLSQCSWTRLSHLCLMKLHSLLKNFL